jgi:aspartyl-tRNA(Asn)/glutamyl-tRNA(Gln) amidotransferase subunit A
VGLKPSYGRVSRHGVTPLAWSLDHAGPMARSVRDVARCLGVLAGHDPRDASSAREPVPDYEGALGAATLPGRRYAIAPELLEQVDPDVLAVFEAALGRIETLGARRVDVALPSAAAANICSEIIIGSEAAAFHEENLKRPERRELLDPAVRMYATCGRVYLAADYVKAQRLRARLQAELAAAQGQADVLLCPSEPTLTPKLGEAPRLQGRELMWFEYGTVNLGNLTGAPALSLPCGFSADGMPVGLQVYGRVFDEASVLGFAHAYEQGTDWRRRRPALAGA